MDKFNLGMGHGVWQRADLRAARPRAPQPEVEFLSALPVNYSEKTSTCVPSGRSKTATVKADDEETIEARKETTAEPHRVTQC